MGGRAAHEDAYGERFSQLDGVAVVNADVASDLVVQADLGIQVVFVSGELNSIHSKIGGENSRVERVFCIDLREQNERAAVIGPALDLREIG